MHSRKKGKSGSKKPERDSSPAWVAYSKADIEELIIKLVKEGNSPSKVGLILRDQYGIPDVRPILKSKITEFLNANDMGLKLPEDIQSLINKSVALSNHTSKHPHDKHNKVGLMLIESKIRRLAKYYIRSGKLPTGWRYDSATARLLVSK